MGSDARRTEQVGSRGVCAYPRATSFGCSDEDRVPSGGRQEPVLRSFSSFGPRVGQGLLGVGMLTLTGHASAQSGQAAPAPPVDLTWNAPPECPSGADVLRHLSEIVEPVASGTHLEARATITKTGPSEFHLVVEATAGNAKGVRSVTATSCSSLSTAAAIILNAMLADEQRETEAQGATVVPAPLPAPSASADQEARARPASPPAKPRPTAEAPLAWKLGLAAAVDIGTLPNLSPGIALSLGVETRRRTSPVHLRFGLLGTGWLPETVTFDTPSRPSAHFTRFDAGGYGCVPFDLAALKLGPCAEAGATWIAVSGQNVPSASTTNIVVPYVAGGALAEVSLTGALHAVVRLDATFPIGPPAVGLRTAEGSVRLHELSLPAFRGLVGVELSLP